MNRDPPLTARVQHPGAFRTQATASVAGGITRQSVGRRPETGHGDAASTWLQQALRPLTRAWMGRQNERYSSNERRAWRIASMSWFTLWVRVRDSSALGFRRWMREIT